MAQPTLPPPLGWPAPSWRSVTPPPSKAHRRKAAGIAAFALVSLAAAMTGTVLVHDDSPDTAAAYGGLDIKDRYSLSAAAVRAQDLSTMSYSFEMTSEDGMNMTADVDLDIDEELMSMSVESDQFEGSFDYIVDLHKNLMYMSTDTEIDLGIEFGDADWIKLDLDELGAENLSPMLETAGDNPLDATAMLFDTADDVTDLGFDEVRGERVRHYEVTVGAVTPADFHGLINDDEADTVTYDAYVTEDNQLVRLSYGSYVSGDYLTMDITVTEVGEVLDLHVPARSTVISFDDLDF